MARTKPAAKPTGGVVQGNGDELLCPQPAKLKKLGGSGSDRFNSVLANMVVDTLWTPPGMDPEFRQQRRTAALAALHGFGPRDEVEGMMAAQAVALHHAAMECLRRAMIPDQPGEAAAKLRRDAANLSRAAVDMAEAIDRRRGKGPQVVRVERVVVQDGGQAIVGAVAATSAPAREGGRP